MIHPEAKVNFNKKGNDLFPKLVSKVTQTKAHQAAFEPDIYISQNFGPENIIGEVSCYHCDGNGNVVERWFSYKGTSVGLTGDDYRSLLKLAENIQRNKVFKDKVSISFVEASIFEWIKENYQRAEQSDLIGHINRDCSEVVQEREIWIPISSLHVQNDLEVGRVIFRTITREMLDVWTSTVRQAVPNKIAQAQFEEYDRRERRNVQGFAAAVVRIEAEENRAVEVAFELTEEALAVLRTLSPYNLAPNRICYCVPLGRENMEKNQYFNVLDGKINTRKDGFVDSGYQPWFINNGMAEMLRTNGLTRLSDVLKALDKSEFQESIIEALMMYSKSCLMKSASDKLVYILVALESLLLRNENEPIQQNIGERMAFAISPEMDERRAIAKLIKDIYGVRSRFIHHGRDVKNLELLENFMLQAFLFFINVSLRINDFKTKSDFIESLEELKFS